MMKLRVLSCISLLFLTLFTCAYSCGQNGPTQPSVVLTWTQSATSGVTANCVYRSTGSGTTPAPPAIYCSTAAITTYTDTSVAASTNYVYAVTAKVGATEGGYSNTASAAIPAAPAAPSSLTTSDIVAQNKKPSGTLQAKVAWAR
jgi:hypothetical protein